MYLYSRDRRVFGSLSTASSSTQQQHKYQLLRGLLRGSSRSTVALLVCREDAEIEQVVVGWFVSHVKDKNNGLMCSLNSFPCAGEEIGSWATTSKVLRGPSMHCKRSIYMPLGVGGRGPTVMAAATPASPIDYVALQPNDNSIRFVLNVAVLNVANSLRVPNNVIFMRSTKRRCAPNPIKL